MFNVSSRKRNILIVLAWALALASILLQGLIERETFTSLDLLLMFFVSMLAGVVLVDAERIVYGFISAVLLCLLSMFICLTLPIVLGRLQNAGLANVILEATLVMIFKSVIATGAPILALMGGLIGGALSEWLKLF